MSGFQTFSTQGLTNSGIPDPGCAASINADIWFAVTAPASGDMDIATLAGTMNNAAMAFYAGPCNNLSLIACTDDDNCGNTIMPVMQYDDLIPGQTYYIRIWPEGAGGSFEIRVTDGAPTPVPLDMQTVGSATYNGPYCIELTQAVAAQGGCAWENNLVDFSQPFTNTITMNFGTLNANGADGICMVYHNAPAGNGACGVTGGGIGAQGIQNSFIIEFDTWDNGVAMGDIPDDHVSVNVNGTLNSPIQGPVSLGNIEDGQDHEVSFSWDPATNSFTITFDGIPYISGNYDIINNCFGGTTNVWCGFTASTGGAVNLQEICSPSPPSYPAGSETIVDVEICQGETYFAGGAPQTNSGTYFDFFPAANGCDSTIITNLTVNPTSLTIFNETLCGGDCFSLNGIDYCETGSYQQTLTNYLGCDSLLSINLIVLDPQANIATPAQITCDNPIVTLNGSASTVGPGVNFQWTGPSSSCFIGDPNAPAIGVTCPGDYTLMVTHSINGFTCTDQTTVTVTANVETILIDLAPIDTINCETPCISLDASGSTSGPAYTYLWTGPNNFTSTELSPEVCEPGSYSLTIENPSNGCMATANIEVPGNNATPEADAGPDQVINCNQDTLQITGSASNLSGGGAAFLWLDDSGDSLGNQTVLIVQTPGSYILEITDSLSGCSDLDTVLVSLDQQTPFSSAGSDQTLDCTQSSVTLDGSASDMGNELEYQWIDEQGNIIDTVLMTDVDEAGIYFFIVTNSQNGCTDTASVTVFQDQNAPVAIAGPDLSLTCDIAAVTLDGTNSTTSPSMIYTWQDADGNVISNSLIANVDLAGTYTLTVENTQNNCLDSDTMLVSLDTLAPVANTGPDQVLNCYFPEQTLGDSLIPPGSNWTFLWTNSNQSTVGDSAVISVQIPDTYVLEVTDLDNGCSSADTVIVLADNSPPVADPGQADTLSCSQTAVLLNAGDSSGSGILEFVWQNTAGDTLSLNDTLTVSAPDTYLLSVLDQQTGCVDSNSVSILENNTLPAVQAGPDQVLNCYQPALLYQEATASGSSGALDLQWFDEQGQILSTELNVLIENAGAYVFQATDLQNGCTQTDTLEVTASFTQPFADAGADQVLDCNTQNVLLDGSNSSTGPEISYSWLNPNNIVVSDSATAIVSEAGFYQLIVADTTNGCFQVDTVQVSQDADLPVADPGSNDTLNCMINSVTLDGSASSSGPNFTYSWTNAQGQELSQASTLVTSNSGIYTLAVLNTDNNCQATATVEVAQDTLAPTADAGPGDTLNCYQPDLLIGGPGTSQGPSFAYSWENELSQQIGTDPTLAVNMAGLYTLFVTNENNGCNDSVSVQIEADFTTPLADAGADITLSCYNPSDILDGNNSTATAGAQYSWTNGSGQLIGTAPSVTVQNTGPYFLSILNPQSGCSDSDTIIVSANFSSPIANAGADQLLSCLQTNTVLNGTNSSFGANLSILWSDINNNPLGTAISLSTDMPGLYYLLLTDTLSGCSSLDSVLVETDQEAPVAEAGLPQEINCYNPQVSLSASGSDIGPAFTYSWTDPIGGLLVGDFTINVSSPGIYTLTVLNTLNGCSSLDSVLVTESLAPPLADAGTNQTLTCFNPSVLLDGSNSSQGLNIEYAWENNGTLLGDGIDISVDQAGDYMLTVTDLDNGCFASDTVSVDQDLEAPQVSIVPPQMLTCAQSSVQLDGSASSGGPNFSVNWTAVLGSPPTPTNDPLIVSVDQPGTYLLWIQDNENGCADTVEVDVLQDIQPPTANAGPAANLNCFQSSTQLDGSLSNPSGLLTFSWDTADGIIDGGNDTPNPTISSPGTYQLTVENVQNGCTDTDQVVITASFLQNFEVDPMDPLCFGESGQIHIQGVEGGLPPYLFSIDGGTTFSDQTTYANLPAGNYELLVQDAEGCTLESNIALIEPAELTLFLDSVYYVQQGEAIQLFPQTNIAPAELASINWSPATGLSCSDCLAPTAAPERSTNYSVELFNSNGCSITGFTRIVVDRRPRIYVPNGFSPDNDGINDVFLIFADDRQIQQVNFFRVFTRWGEPVFLAENFQPNDPQFGWDGRFRGDELDPGVFVWVAEVAFIDGRVEVIKGDVTLVR